MTKKWDRKKALEKLHIIQEKWDTAKDRWTNGVTTLHGYSYGSYFAVNPASPWKGAAGFHEMAHIVFGHTFAPCPGGGTALQEMEACATSILCLKGLDSAGEGAAAQMHSYLTARAQVKVVPVDFRKKVETAAKIILDAGWLQEEKAA